MSTRFAIAKERVVSAIDDVVPELFGSGLQQTRRYANRWAVANKHRPDAKLSQMTVWRDGGRRGAFRDYAGTAQGDAIDLVAYGLTGLVDGESRKRAVEWIEDRFGIRDMTAEQRRELAGQARLAAERRAAQDKMRVQRNRQRARRTFYAAAEGILNTPVETYFEARGIALRQVPALSAALRFRAECEYWPGRHFNGGVSPRFPALVSAMVNVDGHIGANHFTFLEPDGRGKLDTLSRGFVTEDGEGLSAKLMFPETSGLFVPATYGPGGRKHYEAAPLSDLVGATEGIEDALSAALGSGALRMHAVGSLSGFSTMPDLDCAKAYLVFRDNDWGKPQAAALFERGAARLSSFGKPVEILAVPAEWGKDINDALNS